jgi:hypothetical protein
MREKKLGDGGTGFRCGWGIRGVSGTDGGCKGVSGTEGGCNSYCGVRGVAGTDRGGSRGRNGFFATTGLNENTAPTGFFGNKRWGECTGLSTVLVGMAKGPGRILFSNVARTGSCFFTNLRSTSLISKRKGLLPI